MLETLKNHKLITYMFCTGIYGIARALRGSYDPPYDVLGNRIILSLGNGLLYAVYAPYYQLKLLNRIHIKLSGKDPLKYKESYVDLYCINSNVFL